MDPPTTQPADPLAQTTREFEKLVLQNKSVLDNEIQVGYTIPRDAIQPSITTPSDTLLEDGSIQHRASSPSPRLAFLQLVTGATFSPPTSSSSSSTSWSSPDTTPPASPILPPASHILFSTEYFEVRKSAPKGYGAFATKDIEIGTIIISEKPLFKAEMVEIYAKYEGLTVEERAEYRKLCYWKKLDQQPTIARFLTNRFEVGSRTGGIFIKCSRFNHACPPYKSCTYMYNQSLDQLEVRAYRSIKKGEEITISYTNQPHTLYGNYGFHCDCPQCKGFEDVKRKSDNDEPWLKPGGIPFGEDGRGLDDIMYRHYRTFR